MTNTHAADEWPTRATRARSAGTQSGPNPWQAPAHDTTHSNSQLLSAPGIRIAANSAPRAALIHSMQRAHGNRAVQRSVQRQTVSAGVPVQRFWDDMAGALGLSSFTPASGGFLRPEQVEEALGPSHHPYDASPSEMPPHGGLMPTSFFDEAASMPPTGLLPSNFFEESAPMPPTGLLDPLDPIFPFPSGGLIDPIAPFGPGGLIDTPSPAEAGKAETRFKSMDDLLSWGGAKLGGAADFVAENPGVVLSLLGGGFSGGGGKAESSLWSDPLKWAEDTAELAADDPLGALKEAWEQTPAHHMGREANEFFSGKTEIGPDGKPRKGPSEFDRMVNSGEAWVADGARSLAADVEDVPGIGAWAKSNAELVADTAEVLAGGTKALGGMAGGIGSAVSDPGATAKGLWKMGENLGGSVYNPFLVAHAGYDVVTGERGIGDAADYYLNPFGEGEEKRRQSMVAMAEGMADPYKQAYEQGRYGEMFGRAVVDIGGLFLGAGEIGAAGKAGRAAKAADTAADVGRAANYADDAARASRAADVAGDTVRLADNASDLARPRPPQKVMEMDAVPPDFYPGMPQPPGWKSGPYGFRGPGPVDAHGKTLPGVTYDPMPGPSVQIPASRGGANPYGPTVDVGTGPANPHGKTWLDVSKGGVDPHAKTMRAPSDPYGPTMPGYGARGGTPEAPTRLDVPEFSPYAPTQPGVAPVNPYGPTQPGVLPASPNAYTIPMPAQPGISPKAHTLTPQPLPYAPTIPLFPPGPTLAGMPTIPGLGGGWNTLLDFIF